MLREDRYKKKMGLGQDGNALVMLLATIVIIFCITKFIFLVYRISGNDLSAYYRNILNWFLLSPDIDKFMTRPWSILTHMFVHDDTLIMIGNVLWLWAFGYILQDLAGNNKLIPIFIYGSIAGAVFFMLAYNIFPKLALSLPDVRPLDGAAAGVMGVAIATTMLAPDYRIFPMINGGIALWILTLIFVVVDMVSITRSNAAVYINHLAGGAMGYFFVLRLRKGKDWSIWMINFADWIANLFNPDRKSWKKTAKGELYYKSKNIQPYKKIPNITQKRIDDILDKINQQGYRFLTDEEKEILKRASEDDDL